MQHTGMIRQQATSIRGGPMGEAARRRTTSETIVISAVSIGWRGRDASERKRLRRRQGRMIVREGNKHAKAAVTAAEDACADSGCPSQRKGVTIV